MCSWNIIFTRIGCTDWPTTWQSSLICTLYLACWKTLDVCSYIQSFWHQCAVTRQPVQWRLTEKSLRSTDIHFCLFFPFVSSSDVRGVYPSIFTPRDNLWVSMSSGFDKETETTTVKEFFSFFLSCTLSFEESTTVCTLGKCTSGLYQTKSVYTGLPFIRNQLICLRGHWGLKQPHSRKQLRQ